MLHRLKVSGKVTPMVVARPHKIRVPLTTSNFHRPIRQKAVVMVRAAPHVQQVRVRPPQPRAVHRPFTQVQQVPKPSRQTPTIVIRATPTRPIRSIPPNTQQKITELRKKAQERGKVAVKGGLSHPNAFTGYYHKITAAKNSGAGRVLVMIAAGPSINEVNFVPLRNHDLVDFMCVNKPHKTVWPSKYWAFCDHTQHRRNEDTWNSYSTGQIWNSPNVRARKGNQIVVNVLHGKGFSLDITRGYHIGRSSTYAAMQIANYMGYRRIYVFGMDMGASPTGQLHWYGQNEDVSNEIRKSRFEAEAGNYMWAAQNLPKEVREKFYIASNWNKWPFVEFFNRADHLTAVDEILKYISEPQK